MAGTLSTNKGSWFVFFPLLGILQSRQFDILPYLILGITWLISS